jgi:pimeloyl-ACP methyl ester carboxylesterase
MALGKLPGFEERFARVKGTQLRYFVAGEGASLVLAHGLGGAAANWVELAPTLARRRRVLVPDLPGHAGSEPLGVPVVGAYADRVVSLMEREGMLPAALVGHSFGGLVALRAAVRRPEAVSCLVLAAGAGISSRRRLAQAVVSTIGLVRPGRVAAQARGRIGSWPLARAVAFGRWGATDPASLSPAAVEGLLAPQFLHTDTWSAGRALAGEDPRLELDRVRCPCLVLWGARDAMVPAGDGFEFARRLGAPLRVIADCGHLLIAERPEACLDAIESFLDRIQELDKLPLQPEAIG